MEFTVTLERYTLRNLVPDVGNAFVIGVIIAKQSPRKLPDNRAVWNFTLRDSPQDYINATCWGSKDSITLLNEKFQIGDVGKIILKMNKCNLQAVPVKIFIQLSLVKLKFAVEVVKPKVDIRRLGDYGEQFRPMVTSPYTLILNEQSSIINYEGRDYPEFVKLLHYPTKPLATFVSLADVHRKGATEPG